MLKMMDKLITTELKLVMDVADPDEAKLGYTPDSLVQPLMQQILLRNQNASFQNKIDLRFENPIKMSNST